MTDNEVLLLTFIALFFVTCGLWFMAFRLFRFTEGASCNIIWGLVLDIFASWLACFPVAILVVGLLAVGFDATNALIAFIGGISGLVSIHVCNTCAGKSFLNINRAN